MANEQSKLPQSSRSQVDAFLQKAASLPHPSAAGAARLLFAMDATASREPTWDQACRLQADMFTATSGLGRLSVQLCYYRGFLEFRTTPWVGSTVQLAREMSQVKCAGGTTQIARVLEHATKQSLVERVRALVFVGDCMEESIDQLCHLAGKLALGGTPALMFQEGYDQAAERAFREIARLTRGAHCRFDASSASQLRDLLGAAAIYAVGGRRALERYSHERGAGARALLEQMSR